MKLTGIAAIEYAEANDLTLSKYNDSTEDAREGLTPAEARKVASEDPSLIYINTVEIPTTFKATYKGQSLGSFATAEDAEAAIDRECEAEQKEGEEFVRSVRGY